MSKSIIFLLVKVKMFYIFSFTSILGGFLSWWWWCDGGEGGEWRWVKIGIFLVCTIIYTYWGSTKIKFNDYLVKRLVVILISQIENPVLSWQWLMLKMLFVFATLSFYQNLINNAATFT